MRQRLTSISVHQTAKTVGAIYALIALILAPLAILAMLLSGELRPVWALALVVAAPVFYGLVGYLFIALASAVYNLVAGRLGGIEITLRTQAPPAA